MKKFYQIDEISTNISDVWKKAQKDGFQGLSMTLNTQFKKSSKKEGYFATFSTPSTDRHGDVVEQNWDLKEYKKNPTYLDSHNYSSIERILGKVEGIRVKDGKLVGRVVFATDNPLGALAEKMVQGGFLNASSVGFIPLEFDEKFEKITKSLLLEISGVAVPANPEALYEKQYEKLNDETSGGDIPEENDTNEEKREEIDEGGDTGTEKKTAQEIVKDAIQKELDTKLKNLKKISMAIRLLGEETKGRNSSNEDRAEINNQINQAVRNLIKMKLNK